MFDLTRDLDEHVEDFQNSWKLHHPVYMSHHHPSPPYREGEATYVINISTAKIVLHYKQASPDFCLKL